MIKRICPLLLAFALVLCVVPLNAAAAGSDTILNYPTPSGVIDYIYLKYEISGEDQWVQASVTQNAQLNGYIINPPQGFTLYDCKGFGIWLYSPDQKVNTATARFVISTPALYDSANSEFLNFFEGVNFNTFQARFADPAQVMQSKLTLGYINEIFAGSQTESTPNLLDITFYQLMQNAVLEDNIEKGNIFFSFDFTPGRYGSYLELHYISGYVNTDIAQVINTVSAEASRYNSQDYANENFLESSSRFFNNLTALNQSVDPFTGLSVSASLAAVYNPVIDSAYNSFVNGNDRFTFLFMVIIFVLLVVSVNVHWLRRE